MNKRLMYNRIMESVAKQVKKALNEDTKPRGYWMDEDNCRVEAKKYNSRSELLKGNKGAYMGIYKNHPEIFDEIYGKKDVMSYRYWKNADNCRREARKYDSRNDLIEINYGIYSSILRHHPEVLEEIFGKNTNKPAGYWMDEDNCREEAKKYNSRNELKIENEKAYNSIIRNHPEIFDEVYGGYAERKINKNPKPRGYWLDADNCRREALKYNTRNALKNGNKSGYDSILINHPEILDEIFGKTLKKLPIGYWNDIEICREEARKYNSRNELKTCNYGAYQGILRHHPEVLDELYGKNEKRLARYWMDEDNCIEEAKKYNSRSELEKANRAAYEGILRYHPEIFDELYGPSRR